MSKEEKMDVEAKEEDVGGEKDKERSTLMQCAEWEFLLSQPNDIVPDLEKKSIKASLLTQVEKDAMTPYYKHLNKKYGWTEDQALITKLEVQNADDLKKIEEKIEDAKKNLGDTEVREGMIARAELLARIGEKDVAIKAFTEAQEKTAGSGGKIDIAFAVLRIGFLHNDMKIIKSYIETARNLVENGGDWERRNLFKIYEAVYFLLIREFKQAAKLFLESVATFTCYELFSYNTFIFYTVVTTAIAVDRIVLRDKVVKNPDIMSVYGEIPNIEQFIQSLYKCQYHQFFQALSNVIPQIKRDPYLSSHFQYYMREIRIVAYRQFLQSYRSVTLQSMSDAFGVSVAFLDKELARFIANGRLNAKIDKVNGVVETNRPDAKNAQYQDVLKSGDALLNRIQKLTKIISY